jgi:hypothetical protein
VPSRYGYQDAGITDRNRHSFVVGDSVYQIGQNVLAVGTITEDGESQGSEDAEFPDGNYIHAITGDRGEVLHLNEECLPTVRFERTGTATIVGLDEITPLGKVHDELAYLEGEGYTRIKAGLADRLNADRPEGEEIDPEDPELQGMAIMLTRMCMDVCLMRDRFGKEPHLLELSVEDLVAEMVKDPQ